MRTIHRDIAGVFIFSNDVKILLGKSQKGGVYEDYWIIPGGGVEEGESKLDAAKRETLEEVGIDITPFDVKPLDLESSDEKEKTLPDTGEKVKIHMTFYCFTVHADKPASEIEVRCGDDIAEAAWHPVSELPKLSIPPTTKTALQKLGLM